MQRSFIALALGLAAALAPTALAQVGAWDGQARTNLPGSGYAGPEAAHSGGWGAVADRVQRSRVGPAPDWLMDRARDHNWRHEEEVIVIERPRYRYYDPGPRVSSHWTVHHRPTYRYMGCDPLYPLTSGYYYRPRSSWGLSITVGGSRHGGSWRLSAGGHSNPWQPYRIR